MGRYAYGDEGFEYKYAFGDQSADLVHLATLSGAGTVALFWNLEVEGGEELAFREETTTLAPYEDPGEAFAARARAMVADLQEGRRKLDESLERPLGAAELASKLRLVAYATYELGRDEWPALLGWVRARIPPRLALGIEEVTEGSVALQQATSTLDPAEPLDAAHDLALAILGFAAQHDLEDFGVEDGDPLFDVVVHDPSAPIVELSPMASDGASYERELFDAYARRADGVVLTPPPKSRGSETAAARALAELEHQTTELFLAPARDRLEAGDGAAALPYLVASLQGMTPGWARARAVRAMVRRALSLVGDGPPDLDAVWDVLERAPSFDLELAVLHRLANGHGLDPDLAAALRARTYADTGAKKRARATARAVVDDPDASAIGRAAAALTLAELAEARGDRTWQRRWLERALEGALPDRLRHEALRYLGELHEEAGRKVRALHCYEQAIALRPKLPFAHFRRAFVLDLLGRPRASINAYTRTLELDPTFENARFNRACEHGRVGNVERALTDLARAIAEAPEHRASARGEAYFASLRKDPRFKRLVGR
jgi:tetratricopeptide (TPR) repeat protein